MSEEKMVSLVHDALAKRGVEDEVLAVGEFNPRGHTGGMFVGGLAGDEALGGLGGVADGVGVAAGSLAGMGAADSLSGLPSWMLIGVTATTVHEDTGSTIGLEGSRVPVSHQKDVIDVLSDAS